MSDLNALAQKIDALNADDDVIEDGARVISQGGTPAPLNAFLTVIDETVLERRLDFATGESTVSVIAAGRRLRGLIGILPETDNAATVIGMTLSRQEPDILDTAFAVLSDVLETANKLTVRSAPTEPFGTSGERGISASGLAQTWNIDLNEAPLPPMSRFLRANEAAFRAVLHVSAGDVLTANGDVAGLHAIWETQVDAFLRSQESLAGDKGGPKLICLEGAIDGDDAAALALAGDDVALVVYEPTKLGALHASWQSIFQ